MFDTIEYIEYVLTHNVFSRSEVSYYRGESKLNRNPHGLPRKLWNEVADRIGFTFDNLIESSSKFYMETHEDD